MAGALMAVKSKDLYPAIFSRYAAAYSRRLDQVMSRGEARGRQRVIELVEARPGMRIVDLACGPGNLAVRLAAAVAPDGEVVGVDLARGMIEVARSRAIPNSRFELMDIEALEFSDGSFDAATCGHGLQFAPHMDRVLAEARRVLRPGSTFAASVPFGPAGPGAFDLIDAVVDRHMPPAPSPDDQAATRHTLKDPNLLAEAAREAGFASAQTEMVEDRVLWESADQLVALFSSWWDCAVRMERLTDEQRAAFIDDALETLHRDHNGPIESVSQTLILNAIA